MEKTITIQEMKAPYGKVKSQRLDNYIVLTKEELQKAFKNYEPIYLNVEGTIVRHNIQPRVVTYTKQGKISKTSTEKIEWYNEYKKFLVNRFKKGLLLRLRNNDD